VEKAALWIMSQYVAIAVVRPIWLWVYRRNSPRGWIIHSSLISYCRYANNDHGNIGTISFCWQFPLLLIDCLLSCRLLELGCVGVMDAGAHLWVICFITLLRMSWSCTRMRCNDIYA